MSEWISVKDRLPETGVEVLAYSDGDIYTVVHCIDGSWIASSTYYDLYHVTHWMPLPEPPDKLAEKEEYDDENIGRTEE